MKKILFAALAFACIGFGFTACEDDDDDAVYIYSEPIEQVAGTYEGTWTSIYEKDTITAAGTIEIAPDSTRAKYLANVNVPECSAVNLDSMSSVANLVQAGQYGFSLVNVSSENGFATSFRGRVSEEGQLTLNFTKKVRVGRKSNTYSFTFVGDKTASEE
jgi:hypothetical protein